MRLRIEFWLDEYSPMVIKTIHSILVVLREYRTEEDGIKKITTSPYLGGIKSYYDNIDQAQVYHMIVKYTCPSAVINVSLWILIVAKCYNVKNYYVILT